MVKPTLPPEFLTAAEKFPGIDAEALQQALATTPPVSIRLNPFKPYAGFDDLPQVPWCPEGRYLPERPSFTHDPLFHAGTYYVQEASSMFLDFALRKLFDPKAAIHVLDLCGAPGGKSTNIASRLNRKSLLVANEVIATRTPSLIANLTKWGTANTIVTQNDPKDFARLPGFFDVIVIDAPCSGSGLFRKEPEAMKEWSENNVDMCARRQQRILADVWPALKAGGLLLYSTCSYSPEENENIADWILDEFAAETVPVGTPENSGIYETISPNKKAIGYRFYPGKVKGEGFFFTAFRKLEDVFSSVARVTLPKLVSRQEMPNMSHWVYDVDKFALVKEFDDIIAFIPDQLRAYAMLKSKLRIRTAGTRIGRQLPAQELIPDHALALGLVRSDDVPAAELDRDTAIKYLRRETIQLPDAPKGWTLITHQGFGLGWVKVLANRVNNYFPQDWRILK